MHPIISPWTKACLKFQQKQQKHTYICKLNKALLNDNLVNEEIKKEIKEYIEFNENEAMPYQNLLDTIQEVQREKLIALSASKKEIAESLHQQLDKTTESSRIKRSKYTQEEQTARNNQTQG